MEQLCVFCRNGICAGDRRILVFVVSRHVLLCIMSGFVLISLIGF